MFDHLVRYEASASKPITDTFDLTLEERTVAISAMRFWIKQMQSSIDNRLADAKTRVGVSYYIDQANILIKKLGVKG